MIVRFGFVAMSLLLKNASPSKTMTYATLSKLADREAAVRRLERIAEENLANTLRILKHMKANQIQMYRFSSKLIPLATHEQLQDWNPFEALTPAFQRIGEFVREHKLRVSFHPDHFCVLSTPHEEVLRNSELTLLHHVDMLEAMGLDESSKCNIHMGGAYGDKAAAEERFIRQFSALSLRCRQRIMLENDDKTFTALETLHAAEAVGVPMVLDIHHHAVNSGGMEEDELIGNLWPRIEQTWQRERERLGMTSAEELPRKVHASSPKSSHDFRSHADYVQAEPLLRFLRLAAGTSDYMDCMLEAKNKDAALMKLIEDLRAAEQKGEGVTVLDDGSIEVMPL